MGYITVSSKSKITRNIDFQFPLWDTQIEYEGKEPGQPPLSIPFMGYKKIFYRV